MAGLLICILTCFIIKAAQPGSFIRRVIKYDIEAIKDMPEWYAEDRRMFVENIKDYFASVYEDYGWLAPFGIIYEIIWSKTVLDYNWFERIIRTLLLIVGVVLILRPGAIKLLGIGCILFWAIW